MALIIMVRGSRGRQTILRGWQVTIEQLWVSTHASEEGRLTVAPVASIDFFQRANLNQLTQPGQGCRTVQVQYIYCMEYRYGSCAGSEVS